MYSPAVRPLIAAACTAYGHDLAGMRTSLNPLQPRQIAQEGRLPQSYVVLRLDPKRDEVRREMR